jgi:oxygen-independent coproporphyrinogen-3 oxidase
VALYLHVPFCISLCPYCDFVVYAGADARGPRARVEAFVDAVATELELRADALDSAFGAPGAAGAPAGTPVRRPLASVYFGGGTPSLLSAATVASLLGRVERRFGLAPSAEITLEANPGQEDLGDLAGLRAAGVTRLSLGAQSMDASELHRLGRRHTPTDVAAAVRAARRAGLQSVSVDLLYDVPGQTASSWARSLMEVLTLPIDHVSAYALALDDPRADDLTGPGGDHLPARAGALRWRARARSGQDQDRAAAMYEHAEETLAAVGFAWYELSNWARPGHEARHNLAYWRGDSWEALGPGAHAYDGGARRRWNAARLDGYLAALRPNGGGRPRLPPGGEEVLGSGARGAERLILGLRLRDGIAVPEAGRPGDVPAPAAEGAGSADNIGGPWTASRRAAMAWAAAEGLAERAGGDRMRLTLRGRLLANEVFERLL